MDDGPSRRRAQLPEAPDSTRNGTPIDARHRRFTRRRPITARAGHNAIAETAIEVVKVGGSLLRDSGLRERFDFFTSEFAADARLYVVGGGAAADVVRQASSAYPLSDESAHWLAIRAMSLHAHLFAAIFSLPVGNSLADCRKQLDAGVPSIVLDPLFELANDNGQCLPVGWHVTSDSIAAFFAKRIHARRLVLLKLVGDGRARTAADAIALGWLDTWFPEAIGETPVLWVNLGTFAFHEMRTSHEAAT